MDAWLIAKMTYTGGLAVPEKAQRLATDARVDFRASDNACGSSDLRPFCGSLRESPSRRENFLPDHQAMSVNRTQAKFAHAPRLVPYRLDDLGAGGHCALVVRIRIVHHQVAEVGMVAQLRGWQS